MSRAAKVTLAASIVVSAGIVWGVHFMQVQEREVSGERAQKRTPNRAWLRSHDGRG